MRLDRTTADLYEELNELLDKKNLPNLTMDKDVKQFDIASKKLNLFDYILYTFQRDFDDKMVLKEDIGKERKTYE